MKFLILGRIILFFSVLLQQDDQSKAAGFDDDGFNVLNKLQFL